MNGNKNKENYKNITSVPKENKSLKNISNNINLKNNSKNQNKKGNKKK